MVTSVRSTQVTPAAACARFWLIWSVSPLTVLQQRPLHRPGISDLCFAGAGAEQHTHTQNHLQDMSHFRKKKVRADPACKTHTACPRADQGGEQWEGESDVS